MTSTISRRSFLRGSAAALALPSFVVRGGGSLEALAAAPPPSFTSFMDVYRQQWTWDKTVRGTHLVNCWYQTHCAWDVYVKDGLVFREEQAAEYEAVSPDLPDFNPRGCQKGGCYSQKMYEPSRLTHPIRRVGERGSGKWERVSWEEALDDIADTYLDVTIREGTDRTIWDLGPDINIAAANAAQARLAQLTHSICLDMNPINGDGHRGAFETFGNAYIERSVDDYFRSDVILVWGANPAYTSIPNAHFFTEAHYNGTKLVVISPDYNASATKADLWVPVRPGSDGALALAVAHQIVAGGHVNRDFVREQTDMPMLVRNDTGKLVTEAEVDEGGADNRFLVIDRDGTVAVAPFRSLDLDGLEPQLEVDRTIRLKDGTEVAVRSVFSLLKERLAPYTPEAVSEMCGASSKLIRQFANLVINAKALSNVTGSTPNKYFHGNLTERSMILIWALLGQIGKPGAGYSAFSLLVNDGWEHYVAGLRVGERLSFAAEVGPDLARHLFNGGTLEMFFKELGHKFFTDPGKHLPIWTSSSLFWNVHGGVADLSDDAEKWVPGLKQPVKQSLAESLEKDWYPLQPAANREPRILFHYCANPLRSVRGSHKLLEVLWPKLKKIVVIDFRMSSTARHAHYVLPAASWYETTDHKWVTPLMPYNHVTNAATAPLGESKTDFWIFTMIAKHIQKRARQRGINVIESHMGKEIRLNQLYDDMTMDGEYGEDDIDKAAGAIIGASTNLSHHDWEEHKEKGFGRYGGVGLSPLAIGNAGDLKEDEPFVALTDHTDGKSPYPTQTRRIQFYLDHDVYLDHDEALPRYKAPPKIGGDYPLIMTGGHPRWSIHAVWRDARTMLRLNRGGPYLIMGTGDAAARGLADGDWLRAYNDVGRFVARLKISPSLMPGQTIMYHAWENYQFPKDENPRRVTPSPINPVELAGGHPHLRVGILEGQPGGFDRDTRIEVVKLPAGELAQLGLE